MNLKFFKKNKDSFFIAGSLLLMLAFKIPSLDGMNPFSLTPYLVTSKLGVVSRTLVGDIIFLFTDFLTQKTLYKIILFFTLLMIFMFSFLSGKVISNLQGDLKQSAQTALIIFLLLPTSIVFLFKNDYFGRLELYQVILSMVLAIIASKKGLHYLCPFIMVAGIMIHQGNIFYMPFCVIALLLEIKISSFSKRRIAVCTVGVIAVIALFLFYQFSPKTLNFSTVREAVNFLQGFTDIHILLDVLYGEYYSDFSELWSSYIWPIIESDSIPDLLYVFPFVLPALVLFISVWIGAFKKTKEPFMKIVFLLCAISPLASVPQFLFANDYGRWVGAIFINQFFMLFYMLYRKEKSTCKALLSVREFFIKHTVALPALIVWMAVVLISSSYNM